MSRDGTKRASINIRYRVSRDDLVVASANLAYRSPEREQTRADIERELRSLIYNTGFETIPYLMEKTIVEEGEADPMEVADEVVSRLWPGVFDYDPSDDPFYDGVDG